MARLDFVERVAIDIGVVEIGGGKSADGVLRCRLCCPWRWGRHWRVMLIVKVAVVAEKAEPS